MGAALVPLGTEVDFGDRRLPTYSMDEVMAANRRDFCAPRELS